MVSLRRKPKKEDPPSSQNETSEGQAKRDNKKNTKKKKEPPKPWGKAERYLVFGTLIGTIVISFVLALYARSWKWPGLPRLSLPDEAFEETFVLEGAELDEVQEKNLTKEINNITRDLSGVYGVYVIDLVSGATFGMNENEQFQAASLIKLPVMSMIYEESEKRKVSMEEVYALREEDKVGGSGSLYFKEAGEEYTYRELVGLMGKQSDNTAFNVIVGVLGEGEVQNYIEEIGMRNTSILTNMTTPKDVGSYFRKLWNNRLLEQENSQEVLESLTETIYEDWLVAGVPESVEVSHKFGRELHVVNDAGIVRGKNPYVLVVMSKGIVESEADEALVEISSAVFSSFGSI